MIAQLIEKPASLPAHSEACLLHRGIRHVEFFDYPSNAMDALRETYKKLEASGFKGLSFHVPMPRPSSYPYSGVACFFLNENRQLRELSYLVVEETLRHARSWNADFVVTHLTYGKTDTADPLLAKELAQKACKRFSELSHRYNIPVNIEYAAYSNAFNRPEQFIEATSQYRELGICLDVGHAMIGSRLHKRDYFDDINILAPYSRSMHLWNTKGADQAHIPLHPSQLPQDGWIDMERTLEIILARNPGIAVVFEYPVVKVTPEIQSGYDWVEKMVAKITNQLSMNNK